MDNLPEIKNFLQAIPPFDQLDAPQLDAIVKEISIMYLRRNQSLASIDNEEGNLYLVKKGVLSAFAAQGELLEKYSEGDICSLYAVQQQEALSFTVTTEEDCLLYSLPYPSLQKLLSEHAEALAFFEQSAAQRLNQNVIKMTRQSAVGSSLMLTPVSRFYHRPVATIEAEASIRDAARKMSQLDFSCLVVTRNSESAGIVTDKDIRKRCVAAGLDFNNAVETIMTADMSTIDISANAYEAVLTMATKNIHHLPVTQAGKVDGMITATDLMNHEGHNAINFTGIIKKANSLEELIDVSKMMPKLQIRLARLGTAVDYATKSISTITMAFTQRLIRMAEEHLGPAPVPYAWLAAGSQARREQLAHSDQDNALMISDEFRPEHAVWFENFANFVCDGLAACGFIYCPGDVMAKNPKWRQTQSEWARYFENWITRPEPKALMHCSIFFDLETVHGDRSLLAQVRKKMLESTRHSTLFIAHLTHNALKLRPPLGFFKDFVLIQNGKNKATLDLKHNGIAPIVDLARIYALSEGIEVVNTLERIRMASGTPSLSRGSAANLIDAFEFLGALRMEHQVRQMLNDQTPDNFLSPKEISKLEREHMKDAFKVIKTLQDSRQTTL